MSSACFTGHREFSCDDTEFESSLKDSLIKLLTEYVEKRGVTEFYAGGASGFDNFAASCVLQVKGPHPEIKLIEVLPFDRSNMSMKWSAKDRSLLLYLCRKADEVVEKAGSKHFDGCYRQRNQYMVDHADYCIAYYDEKNKSKSGTGQTVRMALKKGIPVENVFQ